MLVMVAIMEGFPIPKLVTNVRAFLGLIGYYKKFILGYAKIIEPLFGLTKKDYKFLWTPICQGAFACNIEKMACGGYYVDKV
jgi:hypothetical protein